MQRIRMDGARLVAWAMAIVLTGGAGAASALEQESKRLARAKDYIAEEQWTRAVAELRTAASDPGEPRRDEILYWLAHSLNQSGDAVTSLTTISELERRHPASLWVKPARALRLEIAMRLGRSDVLWFTVRLPAPPAPPSPAPAPAPAAPSAPAARPPAQPRPAGSPHVPPPPPPPAVAPMAPLTLWMPENFHPDPDLRIQALGHLIRIDADKAIPVLRDMVFELDSPEAASRALFLLAQSRRPEAHQTVVQVARKGPPAVRVAAVRELARFGGPEAATELMEVYTVGNLEVKRQIVQSLGERWERIPLLRIARTERNPDLKSRAILMLGRAGGAESELRQLYLKSAPEVKRSIILSLFNARAEDALIAIAGHEKHPALHQEVVNHLRLLGTPKAREYLQTIK